MKKDNRPYIPHESRLKDEGLSALFARLPAPEPSRPEVHHEIMSRIREIDARRKRREKIFFYVSIGIVCVVGMALILAMLHRLFPDTPDRMRANYTDILNTLSSERVVCLVPCIFFFYLAIDLRLSLRKRSHSS